MSLFLAFFAQALAAEMIFLGLAFSGEKSGYLDGVFLMVKLWWIRRQVSWEPRNMSLP